MLYRKCFSVKIPQMDGYCSISSSEEDDKDESDVDEYKPDDEDSSESHEENTEDESVNTSVESHDELEQTMEIPKCLEGQYVEDEINEDEDVAENNDQRQKDDIATDGCGHPHIKHPSSGNSYIFLKSANYNPSTIESHICKSLMTSYPFLKLMKKHGLVLIALTMVYEVHKPSITWEEYSEN